MPIFANNFVTSDDALGGSVIEKSLRFKGSQYFNRSPSGDGNRRTFTLSLWIKRENIGEHYILDSFQDDNNRTRIGIEAGNGMQVTNRVGGSTTQLTSSQKLRDISGWYHLVYAFDTTQASSSNRIKYYLNGVLDTNVSGSYPSQNGVTFVNHSGDNHTIGVGQDSGGLEQYFKGYMAEIHFIDGVQLDASYFGYTDDQTGIWRPKRYTYGNYGTHGFYLDFLNTSGTTATTLGRDKSGNPNNFTPNNFSVSAGTGNDSFEDTPTNNYSTLNPIFKNSSSYESNGTIIEGNLDHSSVGSVTNAYANVTLPTVGQYYWEVRMASINSASIGIMDAGGNINRSVLYNNDGTISQDNASAQSGLGSWSGGDIIGIAYYGADTTISPNYARIQFYRNGSAQGSALNLTTWINPYIPFSRINAYADFNFGQRAFDYTPPIGFGKLSARDIIPVSPSIIRPQKHFDTLLWTGNATSRNITGLEFKPDFVWIKNRDDTYHHGLFDSIRGANKVLKSSDTSVEATWTQQLMSFNIDGFSLGDNSDSGNYANLNADDYVAWCWRAGGAAVSNSDGTITSQVSANTEAGFSIVSYTGNGANNATVGHGLGKSPDWVIVKDRDSNSAGNNWYVFHSSLTSGHYVKLNQTSATAALSGTSNGGVGSVTSTTFNFVQGTSGNNKNVNESGDNFIAYCWTSIPGYSKFGSYTGNGSTNGPYIHLGFRPAWLVMKRIDSTSNWEIVDNKRDPFNFVNEDLSANNVNAENAVDGTTIDFLSNGFKHYDADSTGTKNVSGGTYIYMAFAEQPVTTPFGTFPNAR